jgi:hypothetical protein
MKPPGCLPEDIRPVTFETVKGGTDGATDKSPKTRLSGFN